MIKVVKEYLEDAFITDKARLKHIYNVEKIALKLARIYGVNEEKAAIASLLHDATKLLNHEENLTLAKRMFDESLLNSTPSPCLHAFSAAFLAKSKFNIDDEEILDAISYHCSGRANMNKLEMIIYISDYVEESRTFVTEELRNLAEVNLEKTVYKILLDTKEYLESNHKAVSNLTLEAIKFYEEICGGI
ncbi:MAG: bis(5'-nucleosyl)-tetraphosphatase (symmetrical) YqeK [Candidatus Izemoplasmatales bacterium]|nr:bis(5'-nucleosyl)-tetraphosphatase (symmetrical) YqeK [Candidatus Izemoplasmatales bacterium]MDD4069418.1 bis(5'-nucleosyl)-tetraphosphatase (symmetrical) YqeK [Candidatus Izemoplasmatales bacterium]